MAKRIEVQRTDGKVDVYESTLFKGYHLHEGRDGICITEKPLFGAERLVTCYSNRAVQSASQERCPVCEEWNPTQQSDYKRS